MLTASCASHVIPADEAARPGEEIAPASPPTVVAEQTSLQEQLAAMKALKQEKQALFTLGKGDVLAISVYGEEDLSIPAVPVRPDGKISFALIGDVQAEGKSVDELTQALTEKLEEYVRSPKISVVVQQFSSLEYTVVGEVVHPGVYPLVTDVSIVKAIAKAGGLLKGQFHASSVELADLTHAFIARDNKVLPVDFVRLFRQGDMRFNIPLHPGDYIYIPSGLSKEIYVLGEVERADLFAFREEITLSKALTMAKGFNADADLSNIHVVRGSLGNPVLIVADLKEILQGKAQDVRLQAGDIVYVPPSHLTSWARMLDKIMPTVQAIQTGIILRSSVNN
ncbi:MAG: polysaccharide biosynthesis/export family protein [Mariprofundaceae bacterium]